MARGKEVEVVKGRYLVAGDLGGHNRDIVEPDKMLVQLRVEHNILSMDRAFSSNPLFVEEFRKKGRILNEADLVKRLETSYLEVAFLEGDEETIREVLSGEFTKKY